MDKKAGEFHKRLLATFKIEAAEHVQALSAGLIELERTTADDRRMEIIETIFREAHSLKGAARAVGLGEIESACQSTEDVLAMLKHKQIGLTPSLLDVLHAAADTVEGFLSSMESGLSAKDKSSLTALLHRLAAAKTNTAPAAAPPPSVTSAPRPAREEKAVLADTVRIATASLDALLFRAEGLLSTKLTAAQRAAELRDVQHALTLLKKERAKIAPTVKSIQRRLQKAARADVALHKLLEFVAWESNFLKSFEVRMDALTKDVQHDRRTLSTAVDALLEDMKRALMLPISSTLDVLPRLVRDVSRQQDKEVELVIRGGEIEVDRRILEEMRDVFVHLVRNSIDHGIEVPALRSKKGKPPRATINVDVTQKDGSRIEILIADDGAGIDVVKVREAARKLGLVHDDGAARGHGHELLDLVFRSGVSTSAMITDISGRGLGLAIVREKVERLGGAVSIQTEPDRGTSFRLVLPLTLATFRGVHVRVNDELFVFPTTHVEQAVRLLPEAIKTVENRETIEWSGRAVALRRLADVLELPRRAAPLPSMVSVVVVNFAQQRIAFLVDDVLHEQEVLVKQLGKQLKRVRNIVGATVLGNGKVVPILNVPDLMKSAATMRAAPPALLPAPTPDARKSILIAEDSITSRMLLKSILESAGYAVATAVDGIDAYTQLRTEHFDLVVSDVEMPRMDGFELTQKIRADKKLAELPLVLVTALGSREHRERGADVGANAYIVKSSFDQSNLLEVVRRLL